MSSNKMQHLNNEDVKSNPMICPVEYKNDLPEVAVDCKFLPCGQDILDYTEEPVSFPEIEAQSRHNFKGLHVLFDVDLVNQSVCEKNQITQRPGYKRNAELNAQQMDPRDVTILADIEALHCGSSKQRPSRALECSQMFAKERIQVPRPRKELLRPMGPDSKKTSFLDPVSVEEQCKMVNQTFEDIKAPFTRHPTKPRSNARPVSVLPIFPDENLGDNTILQMQFDIPPAGNCRSLLKDCGRYLVNFNAHAEDSGIDEKLYISDQRYKEEKTADNAERVLRLVLREKDDCLLYVNVDKHIKLRRERPRPMAMSNKWLLQVKEEKPKAE